MDLQADFPTKTYPKVQILLGSNASSTLACSAGLLRDAINYFEGKISRITQVGDFYHTACFPMGAGPDFVNVAVEVETELTPDQLLSLLHEVEAHFGRERPSRWAPRSLDMDLVCWGQTILPDRHVLSHWMGMALEDQKQQAPEQLIVPHPRMHERGFVLIPLADVAPHWRHPVTHKTVLEMIEDLPESAKLEVKAYNGD